MRQRAGETCVSFSLFSLVATTARRAERGAGAIGIQKKEAHLNSVMIFIVDINGVPPLFHQLHQGRPIHSCT